MDPCLKMFSQLKTTNKLIQKTENDLFYKAVMDFVVLTME